MNDDARKELVRQLIILGFSIAGIVAVGFFSDPDAVRGLKMKGARIVQKKCDKAALRFLNWSDAADAFYEKQRM